MPLLPANVQAQTAGFPDQATFLRQYDDAQVAAARAKPRSIWDMLTGESTTAAQKSADVTGPGAYFQSLGAQPDFTAKNTAAQSGQLGLAQALTFMNRFRAQQGMAPIDLSNIPGTSTETPTQPAAPGQAPTATAAPGPAPVTSTPLPPPWSIADNAAQQPPPQAAPMPGMAAPVQGATPLPGPAQPQGSNPLQARRAMYGAMADAMIGLPNYMKDVPEFAKLSNQGLENLNATALPNGQIADAVSGNPLLGGALDRIYGQKTAEQLPHVEGEKFLDNNRAILTRGTNAAQLSQEYGNKIGEQADQAGYDFKDGYRLDNGDPITISAAGLRNGVAPAGIALGKNPYREAQAKDLETSSKAAQDAGAGIIQAKQLIEAARGLKTGAWGDDIQNIRRGLASLGIGSDAIMQASSKGDVTKAISAELAGLRARAIAGGRTPLGLYNVMYANKPGLMSTDPEAVANAIIPAYQREIDFNDFATQFYGDKSNWNKSQADLVKAFRTAHPDQKYIDMAAPPKQAPSGPPVQAIVDELRRRGKVK